VRSISNEDERAVSWPSITFASKESIPIWDYSVQCEAHWGKAFKTVFDRSTYRTRTNNYHENLSLLPDMLTGIQCFRHTCYMSSPPNFFLFKRFLMQTNVFCDTALWNQTDADEYIWWSSSWWFRQKHPLERSSSRLDGPTFRKYPSSQSSPWEPEISTFSEKLIVWSSSLNNFR
jgi:hypothetical protein